MKSEWKLFLTAIMFYTRIPVPKKLEFTEQLLNKSTRYFALTGWVVGGFGALIFYGCQFIFPVSLSVILSMAATILLTGAFHEDGFADSCDAFGGGWTREKILVIMKDSRIGTYGTVGLVLILAGKYFSLAEMNATQVPFVLFSAHALSRYTATGIIYFSEYARSDDSSKSKPIGSQMSVKDYFISFVFGSTPLVFLSFFYSWWYMIILGTIIPVIYFLKRYFEKWIGGFTGDALGATQQVSEIVFYLCFLVISGLV